MTTTERFPSPRSTGTNVGPVPAVFEAIAAWLPSPPVALRLAPLWTDATRLLTLVLGLTVVLPWLQPNAFYQNDAVSQYYPVLVSIGRSLQEGYWPDLTLQVMQGGNLLGSYQYGLLNPITLASCVAMSLIGEPFAAARLLFFIHASILAFGVYVLALDLKVQRGLAVVAAFTTITNPMFLYIDAAAWWPSMIAHAWLPWALVALSRSARSGMAFVLAALAVALVLASGWPHVTLALGMFVALYAATCIARRHLAEGLGVLLAAGIGAGLAAPALTSLLTLSTVTVRNSSVTNNGFMVFDLSDILNVSVPMLLGPVRYWGKDGPFTVPITYVAWFIVPLVPFMSLPRLASGRSSSIALAGLGMATLMLTQGPTSLGPLKTPFRWLESCQMLMALFSLRVLSHEVGITDTPGRRFASAGMLLGSFVLGLLRNPSQWPVVLGMAPTILAYTQGMTLSRFRRFLPGFLLAGSIAACLTIRLLYPTFFGPPMTSAPTALIHSPGASLQTLPRGYDMLVDRPPFGWSGIQDPDTDFAKANASLLHGRSSIGGYEAIGHVHFRNVTCLDLFGTLDLGCLEGKPHVAIRLSEPLPDLGVSWLDLMRVERILCESEYVNEQEALLSSQGWSRSKGKYFWHYSRSLPSEGRPGMLSFASPHLEIEPLGTPTVHEEKLRVKAKQSKPGRLIWARLAWPGYSLQLGNEVRTADSLEQCLVACEVPAGFDGVVTLRYRPPLWRTSLALATTAAAFLGLIITGTAKCGLFI